MNTRRAIALASLITVVCTVGCVKRTTSSREYSAVSPNARVETPAAPVERSSIEGRYGINGKSSDPLTITRIGGDQYRVEAPGFWEGVGFFDGKVYIGVFRYPEGTKHGSLRKAAGTHHAVLQEDGSFAVHGSFSGDGFGEFDVVWKKL